MTDFAIKIKGVSKRYRIGSKAQTSLKNTLANLFSKNKESSTFLALDNLTLNIEKGQALGIIGKNGAGKSTLLKILSKITYPSSGEIELEGRVSSLLEVGTGFHPELTGRENVFLNGSLLGMTKDEIQDRFSEIVLFSGVGKFLDTPIKHYSSGMRMRLAFAVAAHLDSEILLVDEVLAVGDYEFRKKSLDKMNKLATNSKRTVLFVSHNLAAIEALCKTSILLENGRIIRQGKTKDVINHYRSNKLEKPGNVDISSYRKSNKSKEVVITNVSTLDKNSIFSQKDDLIFFFGLKTLNTFYNLLFEIVVYNEDSVKVAEIYSWDSKTRIDIDCEKCNFKINLGKVRLSPGRYYCDIKVKNVVEGTPLDFLQMFPLFEISNFENNEINVMQERGGFLTIIPELSQV